MSELKIGILALEDDEFDLSLLQRALKNLGLTKDDYKLFEKQEDLMDNLSEGIHLVILDHYLTHLTGLEILKLIRQKNRSSYVIAFTGLSNPDIIIQYIKVGIDNWVKKTPDCLPDLTASLKQGLEIGLSRIKLFKNLTSNHEFRMAPGYS